MWKWSLTESVLKQETGGDVWIALDNLRVISKVMSGELSSLGKVSSQTVNRILRRGELKAGLPRKTLLCIRAI